MSQPRVSRRKTTTARRSSSTDCFQPGRPLRNRTARKVAARPFSNQSDRLLVTSRHCRRGTPTNAQIPHRDPRRHVGRRCLGRGRTPASDSAASETIEETRIVPASPGSIEEVIVRGTAVARAGVSSCSRMRWRSTMQDAAARTYTGAASMPRRFRTCLWRLGGGSNSPKPGSDSCISRDSRTDRDGWEAMAWLGVASRGTSMPEIRNYFNTLWEKVPDGYRPQLQDKIDIYQERYGTRANRVSCDRGRKVGTYLPTLTCRFVGRPPLPDDEPGSPRPIHHRDSHHRELVCRCRIDMTSFVTDRNLDDLTK